MRAERTRDGVVRGDGPVRARVLAICAAVLVALLGAAGWMALQPGQESGRQQTASRPAPKIDAKAIAREPAPLEPDLQRVAPLSPAPERPPEARAEEDGADEGAIDEDDQEITVDQLPRGDGTGLDAFPRPGTKPLQRGLIVPDGYELPPGFVRHYQTTDDGVQLAPILKFHPDHVPEGAPPDGVVPPELAPRDMPQRWLDLPAPERKR
ncbi:MAG TPA: hypothetical protein VI356_09080 [Myxococcales bacterium]